MTDPTTGLNSSVSAVGITNAGVWVVGDEAVNLKPSQYVSMVKRLLGRPKYLDAARTKLDKKLEAELQALTTEGVTIQFESPPEDPQQEVIFITREYCRLVRHAPVGFMGPLVLQCARTAISI